MRHAASVFLALSWFFTSVMPPAGAYASGGVRPDDLRVEAIAYRLKFAGRKLCPRLAPALGLSFQYLGQFALADRQMAISRYHLNQGIGVSVVVPGSPAAQAGVEPGDIVIRIGGTLLANQSVSDEDFDQQKAQAFSDQLDNILGSAASNGPVRLDLLRNEKTMSVQVVPVQACPSRVHLARSTQHNAFADGVHVFITTAIVADAKSDDELAFVLGHEMAHNILQHAALMRAQGVSRGPFRGWGHSGRVVRDSERQADLLGVDLMRAAGYDPIKGAGFLHVVDSGPHFSLSSDHDSVSARMLAIRKHLADQSSSKASIDAVVTQKSAGAS